MGRSVLGPLGAELRYVHLKSKENKGTPPGQQERSHADSGNSSLRLEMYVCECVCVCACARVCMLMRVSGTCTLESLPSQLDLGANSKDDIINTERRGILRSKFFLSVQLPFPHAPSYPDLLQQDDASLIPLKLLR